jgi:membrane associated rhomboid family serine protease
MLPRFGSSKLVSGWITLTLLVSLVAALDGGWLASWAAYAPARIWRGEVWRLVTWVFVHPAPLGLIVTCASIYKFGGELVPRWGERRLRRFVIDVLGGAALVTLLLALISERVWSVHRLGGWAVSDTLVIAWARQYPDAELLLYGLLRLHGRQLIAVTIAITGIYALYHGPLATAPELLACAAAYGYPRERLARIG